MKIGIIGMGNIGASILHGLLATEGGEKEIKIFIHDIKNERMAYFGDDSRIEVCKSNEEVVEKSDVTILAVKPDDISTVAEEIGPCLDEEKILVSVAAGMSTRTIEAQLGLGNGKKVKVIRVMPNIALQVGEAVSAVCQGKYADKEDEEVVKGILSAVGDVYSVNEEDMDVITGLSGSGIAFFASLIDALAEGGVYEGLPYELAVMLGAKTALGAAKMILSGKNPWQIKQMVASPGGTTIAGLYAMETKNVKAAMMEAVIAATKRAREISQKNC
jgi:pyrroline-5-carboxylate reductase